VTRSTEGAAQRRRRLLALRVAAFIAAIALAVIGVWMIVTGNSTKSVRVGAIASFWALLLGAFAVLGSRVPSRDAERFTGPVAPVASQPPPPPPHNAEVDVRHVGDVERATVAAARREFQATLQEMLQREVAAAVSREMAGLRSDVTALRNELVEKVGGQLHLERIETTRLIGSDLEALQHEVQQLRRTAGLEGDPTRSMRITHTLEPPPPGTNHDVRDAEIVVERVHVSSAPTPASTQLSVIHPETDTEQPLHVEPTPEDESAATPPGPPEGESVPQQPAPWPAAAPSPQPAEADAAPPEPEPESAPEPEPSTDHAPEPPPERIAEAVTAAARAGADPFAGLPRLTPFTEFPLEPISASEQSAPDDNGGAESAGHRHRADDEDGDDVLARILARERSR
jgi:hypothetical protein